MSWTGHHINHNRHSVNRRVLKAFGSYIFAGLLRHYCTKRVDCVGNQTVIRRCDCQSPRCRYGLVGDIISDDQINEIYYTETLQCYRLHDTGVPSPNVVDCFTVDIMAI